MSGTNRLVINANAIKGNSQITLNADLKNANEVAKGIKEIPLKSKKK